MANVNTTFTDEKKSEKNSQLLVKHSIYLMKSGDGTDIDVSVRTKNYTELPKELVISDLFYASLETALAMLADKAETEEEYYDMVEHLLLGDMFKTVRGMWVTKHES